MKAWLVLLLCSACFPPIPEQERPPYVANVPRCNVGGGCPNGWEPPNPGDGAWTNFSSCVSGKAQLLFASDFGWNPSAGLGFVPVGCPVADGVYPADCNGTPCRIRTQGGLVILLSPAPGPAMTVRAVP